MASISSNGSNGHHKFTLNVVENSTSTANNTSSVGFSFVLSSLGGTYDWVYSATIPVTYSININGTKYSGNIMSYDGDSTVTIRSGTLTIPHNTDGSKSISFSFSVSSLNVSYLPGSASASGTIALTNIPRYLSITSFEITNKTETSVVVKWSVSHPRSGTYYSLDNGATWIGSATDGETLASDNKSGSFNLPNLNANTTYSLKLKFRRADNNLWTESGNQSFTTYNYPHCISSPDFTIGDTLSLTLYNPLGRNVSVAGYAKTDGREIFRGSSNATNAIGFNDSTSMGEQYASIPNSQDGQYIVVVVYNDIPMTRDAGNIYKIRGNEFPTINGFDYFDGNSSTVAITENNKHIVQKQSSLTAQFGAATPNFGAGSIARYEVSCNGAFATGTTAGAYSLGAIDSAGDVELTLLVTDSRGLTSSKTIKVTMLPYSIPTALVTLKRLNNYEDETYLTVDGTIASVNGKNTMTIQYRYKASGGSYGPLVTIGDNARQTLSLDKNNVYIFNVVVRDSFGSTYNQEHTLGKGVFPLFIDTELNSVGINCFPTKPNSLFVNGIDVFECLQTCLMNKGYIGGDLNDYT